MNHFLKNCESFVISVPDTIKCIYSCSWVKTILIAGHIKVAVSWNILPIWSNLSISLSFSIIIIPLCVCVCVSGHLHFPLWLIPTVWTFPLVFSSNWIILCLSHWPLFRGWLMLLVSAFFVFLILLLLLLQCIWCYYCASVDNVYEPLFSFQLFQCLRAHPPSHLYTN